MTAQTLDALPEFELGSYEEELAPYGEFEHEGEYEDQEFWSSLAGLARRAAQSPRLRRIGLTAARKAIDAIPDLAGSLGQPGAGTALSRNLAVLGGGGRAFRLVAPLRHCYPRLGVEPKAI